ncbi:MAG: carbamoyltransferase C-terminal domain-containing protein [Leuconostoc mesenteroides]
MSNKNALLLSLGHNSSAIYADTKTVIGYETERINKIKSSSASPIIAIEEILKHQEIPDRTPIFMTHWFDQFGSFKPSKYSQGIEDFAKSKDSVLWTHSKSFTHHDAHAWSAKGFFRQYIKTQHFSINKEAREDDVYYIVADGFGNFQEVISIYKQSNHNINDLECVHKCYGYENSLGLMYQYATLFCGMKMQQDEYKFLGYESKIDEFLDNQEISDLLDAAQKTVEKFVAIELKNNKEIRAGSTELIDYDKLDTVKNGWLHIFTDICTQSEEKDFFSIRARSIVAFFIQTVIEETLCCIIDKFSIKNVVLSGGIFYNVKLNNRIVKKVPGLVSVVPVAGDQGAAIGFYERYIGEFDWSTLAISKREFSQDQLNIAQSNEAVFIFKNRNHCLDFIASKINKNEIVNLITGNCEYGPRALCNTSSIFMPNQKNVDDNNYHNRRNDIMPVAPIIRDVDMDLVFEDTYKRVVGSNEFMIVTHDYLVHSKPCNSGVYHKYPLKQRYSGRPQVITEKNNSLMFDLLTQMDIKMLVNTSYNKHGEPICLSMQDIMRTHYFQLKNAEHTKAKINLVILTDQ